MSDKSKKPIQKEELRKTTGGAAAPHPGGPGPKPPGGDFVRKPGAGQ